MYNSVYFNETYEYRIICLKPDKKLCVHKNEN